MAGQPLYSSSFNKRIANVDRDRRPKNQALTGPTAKKGAMSVMGAAPERKVSIGEARNKGERPRLMEVMRTSESRNISLVTTSNNVPTWYRSVFNLDFGFRSLMLLAAMTILGIVGLIVTELLQRSSLAWSKFGLHFFFGSEWDPVSGAFGALPFVYGTLVSSLIA